MGQCQGQGLEIRISDYFSYLYSFICRFSKVFISRHDYILFLDQSYAVGPYDIRLQGPCTVDGAKSSTTLKNNFF